ncbi:MAG TPA: GNAT family N-acetyltransferase [Polyangia bacterium]|nr:GNAT family N-acetyltransferase [Polyangia bacterium]
MRIRSAVAGDEMTLAVLNGFVQQPHVAADPEHFRATRLRDVANWFASLLQQPTAAVWIAQADDVPIGYAAALFHEQAENPFCLARRWCEVDQLAVDPAHQRRGVARALVDAIVADAEANGIRDIELNAWSFNEEATAAFRRMGFQPRIVRLRRQNRGPDSSSNAAK